MKNSCQGHEIKNNRKHFIKLHTKFTFLGNYLCMHDFTKLFVLVLYPPFQVRRNVENFAGDPSQDKPCYVVGIIYPLPLLPYYRVNLYTTNIGT